ncbi:ATP-binding protein [Streptomyces sp. NPDC102406]|uniref:ATP-binding protein n=1 Tax=Streptomyces sp. NPDC102406 TaxID=3366171 RepID=UPI00380D44A3
MFNGNENDDAPSARRVLAFEAVPLEMRRLRHEATRQLERWLIDDIVEEAQLVVTELATNVLHHVGEGAAATLILEVRGGWLRVEVHDKSLVIPLVTRSECGDECGRGLHLIAALVAEWGILLTQAGKAVWCELALQEPHFAREARSAE